MKFSPFDKVQYGIRMMFNFHKEPKKLTAANIVETLDKQWESLYQDSKNITEKFLSE